VRWLVDECVDTGLVELLRHSGHDTTCVSEIAPRATDLEVMCRADSENRLLLTEDKDFGDLIFRQARPVPGIVLLRIGAMQRERKAERLIAAIDRFSNSLLGRYTVVEETRFRSRPLWSS
jgi:predicted nuclease of predicted toxin-antitoxin system